MEDVNRKKRLAAQVMTKDGRPYFRVLGSAYANDSLNDIYLDAHPTGGKLQLREFGGGVDRAPRVPDGAPRPDDEAKPGAPAAASGRDAQPADERSI